MNEQELRDWMESVDFYDLAYTYRIASDDLAERMYDQLKEAIINKVKELDDE